MKKKRVAKNMGELMKDEERRLLPAPPRNLLYPQNLRFCPYLISCENG